MILTPHRSHYAALFASLFAVAFATGCISRSNSDVPEVVDFNQHIRPILSTNCYVCHGPDISTREAGLRLDLRDSAIVALESGETAVVPGHPTQSELIRRVTSSDPEERMPPPELKKVLDEREVALLKRWIEQGAEWKPHWAFIPPEKPDPPHIRRTWKVDNDIDRFIVAELESNGLAPAGEASKTSLIRRLSFVLTGLPPTPEGVQAFLEDESPDAYEKLVDRLLASPHFGERWARHWMDVVRYADTRGHEFDYPVIGASQYRDYLIRAFNDDVPYDQFVKEHLAGDLLDEPRLNTNEGFNESILATNFFALGEGKHSPVDLQIDEAERIDNIIDVTTKAFQGLTVACAKCHDHKFDPIPTTDYYALYGVVKSTRFAIRTSNTTPEVQQTVINLANIKKAQRDLVASQWLGDLEAPQIINASQAIQTPEQPAPVSQSFQLIGDFRQGTFDGWYKDGLAFGDVPAKGLLQLNDAGHIESLALPRASSAAISTKLNGALRSPTFPLTAQYITVRAAGKESAIRVILDNFQLIQNPIYGSLEAKVDDPAMRDYHFDLSMWQGREAYIEIIPGFYERQHYIKRDSAYIEAEYAIAHEDTFSASWMQMPPLQHQKAQNPASLRSAIIAWQKNQARWQDLQTIQGALTDRILDLNIPGLKDLHEEAHALEAQLPGPSLFTGTLDGNGKDQPVFIRGSVQKPSETPVPRRSLTIHDAEQTPFAATGSGRLDLANVFANESNALTARVMVNRLWHHIFGRGIVASVDNFGIQGKLPSHPELLDYLAIRFMENGWSMKSIIREMVLSQSFRRSTSASTASESQDPENMLLQHYPIRRLEAEAIRDAILTTSGRLEPQLYGQSIPVYLSEFMKGRGRPAQSGPLDGDGRRTIYLSVRRNFLSPMLLVFDMPIPFTTFGRRNTSNVPAQSLTLLNDPFVQQQAAHWAQELISLKELDTLQKIEQMYWTALSRPPTREEREAGLAFLEQQARHYQLEASDLQSDHRPWKDLCHTLFNLKEFFHIV